jgi:hypothetical protein
MNQRFGKRVVTIIAAIVMAPVGFLISASGLIAPPWAVTAFVTMWFAAVVVLIRVPAWWRPAVPAVLLVTWGGLLSLGGLLLGWTPCRTLNTCLDTTPASTPHLHITGLRWQHALRAAP